MRAQLFGGKVRVLRGLGATALASVLVLTLPSGALADQAITSAGPLTSVGISSVLNCSVNHTGDSFGEFYNDTACGTLVASGGTLYGPTDIPAGGSAGPRTAYTAVSQTPVTGAGTAVDPFKIVTVVDLGSSNLRLTQTNTYVVGQESYRTDIALTNNGASSANAIIYHAGDCFLADSDSGFGAHDLASGSVTCVGSVDDGQGGTMPGSRIEQFLPLSSGSHSFQNGYDDVWAKIGAQEAFDDTCVCDQDIDNGAGLSWNVTVGAGQTITRSDLITFSPDGPRPTADHQDSRSGLGCDRGGGRLHDHDQQSQQHRRYPEFDHGHAAGGIQLHSRLDHRGDDEQSDHQRAELDLVGLVQRPRGERRKPGDDDVALRRHRRRHAG